MNAEAPVRSLASVALPTEDVHVLKLYGLPRGQLEASWLLRIVTSFALGIRHVFDSNLGMRSYPASFGIFDVFVALLARRVGSNSADHYDRWRLLFQAGLGLGVMRGAAARRRARVPGEEPRYQCEPNHSFSFVPSPYSA